MADSREVLAIVTTTHGKSLEVLWEVLWEIRVLRGVLRRIGGSPGSAPESSQSGVTTGRALSGALLEHTKFP